MRMRIPSSASEPSVSRSTSPAAARSAVVIRSKREERAGTDRGRERRRRCLSASARSPVRTAPSPQDERAVDAAATTARTEQRVQAEQHDNLHVGVEQHFASSAECPDKRALPLSIATFDPSRIVSVNARSSGHSVVHGESTHYKLKHAAAPCRALTLAVGPARVQSAASS